MIEKLPYEEIVSKYRSASELNKKYVKEIERLNNIIKEIREDVKNKIVECYDEGSTIGEFYKICDIDNKIEELLDKGE